MTPWLDLTRPWRPLTLRGGRAWSFGALVGAVILSHGWLMQWPLGGRGDVPRRAAMIEVRVIEALAMAAVDEGTPPVAAVATPAVSAPPSARAVTTPRRRAAPAPAVPAAEPAVAPDLKQPAGRVAARVGGHADDPDVAPLPTYATRLASPIEWSYRLQWGGQEGRATLGWEPDFAAARYAVRLAGEIDGRGVLHWSSHGALDAAGIAPERFLLREPRRGAQAANFERGARRITYSGPPVAHALPDGAQDRLSWLIQLAAVVAADPQRHGAPAATVELFVAGARGDADRWRFEAQGVQALALADGSAIDAWLYVRAPRRPYDVRVEAWLAPALGYLPVRLRVTPTGAGRPLDLLLATAP